MAPGAVSFLCLKWSENRDDQFKHWGIQDPWLTKLPDILGAINRFILSANIKEVFGSAIWLWYIFVEPYKAHSIPLQLLEQHYYMIVCAFRIQNASNVSFDFNSNSYIIRLLMFVLMFYA
jgi:hypothetical protein